MGGGDEIWQDTECGQDVAGGADGDNDKKTATKIERVEQKQNIR